MIGRKRESAFVTQKKSCAFNEMLGVAWPVPAHPRLEYSIRNGIGEANDQKAEEQDQERLFTDAMIIPGIIQLLPSVMNLKKASNTGFAKAVFRKRNSEVSH